MDADRIVDSIRARDDAPLRPSDALRAFTQGWEGCRLVPYLDDAGYWTVGMGHKMQPTDPRVPITPDEGVELLHGDLECAGDSVARLIYAPLSQCQFDALTDFVFAIGATALATSTLRKRVNGGYFDEAAAEFLKWNNERDPVTGLLHPEEGLTKRRSAEVAIWSFGDYSKRP